MSVWKQKAKTSQNYQGELPPAGTYQAVCVALIDLGTQTNVYNNESQTTRRLFIAWELSVEATRPIIGKDFTVSLHTKSALRAWVKNWRGGVDIKDGEEFDISVLLGKPCILTIEHKAGSENTYARVSGISAPMKGMPIPSPQHERILWEIDGGKPATFPEWMPYLYGQAIADWIGQSHEKTGKPVPSGNSGGGNGHAEPETAKAASGASSDEDFPANW